jgi:hypothetical protein
MKTLLTLSLTLSLFTLHSFACGSSKTDVKKNNYSSRAAVLNVDSSCAGKNCSKSKAAAKKGACPTTKAACDVKKGECPVSKAACCEKETAKK